MKAKKVRRYALRLAVLAGLIGMTAVLYYSAVSGKHDNKVAQNQAATAHDGKARSSGTSEDLDDAWTIHGKKLSSGISQAIKRAAAPLKKAAATALAAVDAGVIHAGTAGISTFHQTTVAVVTGPGGITVIGGGPGGGGPGGGGPGGGGPGGGGPGGGIPVPESSSAALFVSALMLWALRRRFRQTAVAALAMTLEKSLEHPKQP